MKRDQLNISFSEFEEYDTFVDQLEDALFDASIAFHNEFRRRISASDGMKHRSITYMLGKLEISTKLQQQRRRYLSHDVDITETLYKSICSTIIERYAHHKLESLDKAFKSYNKICARLDARGSNSRGPRIINEALQTTRFDKLCEIHGNDPSRYADPELFTRLIIDSVSIPNDLADYRLAIANARSCLWFLQNSRHILFKQKPEAWSFLMGYTVRHGGYAAQQCEDTYNLDIFMRAGIAASLLANDRYLCLTNAMLGFHRRGLFAGNHASGHSYAEDGFNAWTSNLTLNGPVRISGQDAPLDQNTATEFMHRGAKLDDRPKSLGGKTIRDLVLRSGDAVYFSKEEELAHKIRYSAFKAETYLLNGNINKSQEEANSGLLVLARNNNILLSAQARLYTILGEIDYKITGSYDNEDMARARDIHLEYGSFRRMAYLDKKIKGG